MVPRLRPAALFLALALLLGAAALSSGLAHAQAQLEGLEVDKVREAEHALAVHIEGMLARVDSRQVVVNEGDRDTEVIYSFDLPADAAVVDAEVSLPDGTRAHSAAVDARAAFRFVPDDDGATGGAPDIGLLRLLEVMEERRLARYELRVYPVPAGRSATVAVHWVAPVHYRDGRLSLRLPDRGGAANLVTERVELAWAAPAGATGLRDIRSGPARLAASAGTRSGALRFHAPVAGDLVLEATPAFRPGQGLIAEIAAVPLDKGRGAVALSLLSPELAPAAAARFERLVVVVDRSRSLGTGGLAAARAIADALVGAANPDATADAVLFDRRARAVLGRLSQDRGALRAGLAKGLAAAPESGSDLGAALSQVGNLLRRQGPAAEAPVGEVARGVSSPTLIVLLTDGMLPLDLDGERARSQLGTLGLAEAKVAAVVLVPDGAPAPDLDTGPLAALARATGGRVLAVRHGEARARAPRLWPEVAQPAPFESVEIGWRGAVVTSDAAAPTRLESGEAFLLLGWYHGRRPAAVAVAAELRGSPVAVRARAAGGALTRATVPLALVQRPDAELLPPTALDRPDAEDRARTEMIRAAHRAGVATRSTALVLLDPRDRFARDRLAHASRWGTGQYRRFPPPAERKLGEVADPRRSERTARRRPTAGASSPRRTGELDRTLVERLMKQHMVPRARACYEKALRREPKLAWTVVIELEMARGEVQHARVARSDTASTPLTSCLLDAAYATPVPQVALGDTAEAIVVARYPLRLRRRDRRIDVSPTADRPGTRAVDPNDPLGGLDDD
jgi:Vault protein inter-alpha-trypsin domain